MPFPIRCAACNKAFNISDDVFERKIRGKVVGIKCRSCGKPIRVDGTKGAAGPAPAPKPKPSPVHESPEPPVAAARPMADTPRGRRNTEREVPSAKRTPQSTGVLWAVDLGEPQHRELTADQIKREILAGNVDAQTLVWHDDMPEWRALADVDELRGLLPAQPKPALPAQSTFASDSADEVVTSARIPSAPSPTPQATAAGADTPKKPLPTPPPRKSAPAAIQAPAPKAESTQPMGGPAPSPPAPSAEAPPGGGSPMPPLPTPPAALPAGPPPLPAPAAGPLGAGIAAAVGPVATSPIPQPAVASPPAVALPASSPGGLDIDALDANFRGKSKTPLILVGVGIAIAAAVAVVTLSAEDAPQSAEAPTVVAPPPTPAAPEAPTPTATAAQPVQTPASEEVSAPPTNTKNFAEMFEQTAKKQDSK